MAEACIDILTRLAKGRLMESEIKDAMDRAKRIRDKLVQAGKTDNLEERVARAILQDVTTQKIKAAARKVEASYTVLAKNARLADLEHFEQYMTTFKAFRALMEGTQRGVSKGRDSVARQVWVNESRYLGEGLRYRIEKERPQVMSMLGTKAFDDDLTKELYELQRGGTPGITKNEDAQWAAKVVASVTSMAKNEFAKFGGEVDHSRESGIPQEHDDMAMQRAGEVKWVNDVIDTVDLNQTLPDTIPSEIRKTLSGLYRTIIMGVRPKSERQIGKIVSPAVLAAQRPAAPFFYFKDANSMLKYRDLYGRGSTWDLTVQYLGKMARINAAAYKFGINAEKTVQDLINLKVEEQKAALSGEPITQGRFGRILRPTPDVQILKQGKGLGYDQLRSTIDQMTGLTSTPKNMTVAHLGNNIQAGFTMAKMGKVLLSSMNDLVTPAFRSMQAGTGFWHGEIALWGEIFHGFKSPEARHIAYLVNEGNDGLLGHLSQPVLAQDGPPGLISKRLETFMKMTGITRWTDGLRGASARVIGADLGASVGKRFEELAPAYRTTLATNSIDRTSWEIMRQAPSYKAENGNVYLLPDAMRALTDEQVKPLGMEPNAAREKLEFDLRGYFADETSQAIIETDPATRRRLTGGLQSGTGFGIAMRLITQFKGYPIAYAQRVLGRTILRGTTAGDLPHQSAMRTSANLAAIVAGMTVSGYMSVLMKEAMLGIWPPRYPWSFQTFGSAFVSGGGLGVYGDYLFGHAAGFGQSQLLELMGPSAGFASDVLDLWPQFKDAIASGKTSDIKAIQDLNIILNNAPFINLFYVKPVFDFLVGNYLREAVSPGYLERQNAARRKNYNQQYEIPRTVSEMLK